MATVNFYLKQPNKKNLCLVVLVYQSKGQKFNFSTKIFVEKENWDGVEIKGKSLDAIEYNKKLRSYLDIIADIQKEALINNKYYTTSLVESKFKMRLHSALSNQSEFFQFYDRFLNESKITKTASTIRNLACTRTRLKDFEKDKKIKLSFDIVDRQLYDQLVSYFIIDRGYLNNTVGKHIKALKAFLNYVKNHGWTTVQYNLFGFKVFKEDVDVIALTEEELFKIYYCKDLSETLEQVKDYFCLECFTGLRFSDIARMQDENVKGDFLEFRTLKTKDTLFVPLNRFAKEIIEKYRGKFLGRPIPPTLTNQKSNEYIKDVAEIAGVTDMMMIEKFSGSRRIVIKKPKCDLITTHTGRKTFISLSFEKKMPAEMIMKITGIRSWGTLKKYLKVSEKSKLIVMNEFWNKSFVSIG
ncbi:MAG: phage integrase SAM-like domain-containing protein [Bacteroidetes bacterium]|nr:phage integrase SAM-like domain-containing protein [Bacteroidota bacterium]